MRWWILVLLWLAACTQSPAQTPIPTSPPLQGDVSITSPGSGSIIYAETLYVAGTALNVDAFLLRVIGADEQIIAQTTIRPRNNAWEAEIVHEYSGDPIEATLFALPTDPQVIGDYDVASVVISSLDNRPAGIYGSIMSPFAGTTVGGDVIPVTGIVSGVPTRTLMIRLERDDEIISQRGVTLNHPHQVDELLWSVDLMTNGATGAASIHFYYTDADTARPVELDQMDILLSAVAG